MPPAPPPQLPPQILECPECGSGSTWPPPERDVESDGLWVEMYGAARLQRRETWLNEARIRLAWISEFTDDDGVLLEVGSGTGEFVKAADDLGYCVYGIEPSSWAAERARELGANVETGFLADWQPTHEDIRPTLVAMWHTLEHVPEPADLLAEVADVLRPGGVLVLEVPNFDSSEAARLGTAWEGAQPEDHYVQFTTKGIAALLQRTGFEVIEIAPLSREVYTPVTSWQAEEREAIRHGRPWPPLDLLRACARLTRA